MPRGFILAALALILIWTALIVGRLFLQKQTRSAYRYAEAAAIDSLVAVEIGACEQWLLIRGKDRSKPLLLFVHGGPGAPLFPQARDIGRRSGLEEAFVVVYWEQCGTGKSFDRSIDPDRMTIDRFVADVGDLTDSLRHRFDRDRIVLLGRSWGALIGLLAVHEAPERYAAFIGLSPLLAPLASDSLSYRRAADLARNLADDPASTALLEIGGPPYDYRRLLAQRRWLLRLHRQIAAIPLRSSADYRRQLLACPEYGLVEIVKMGFDPFFSLKHLWNNELYRVDLRENAAEVRVPVFLLVGRQDPITPAELVRSYIDRLEAPAGKNLFCFEQAGHDILADEPARFHTLLCDSILPLISLNDRQKPKKAVR